MLFVRQPDTVNGPSKSEIPDELNPSCTMFEIHLAREKCLALLIFLTFFLPSFLFFLENVKQQTKRILLRYILRDLKLKKKTSLVANITGLI